MTLECFRLLCCKITASIGESNFKSTFLINEGLVHDCASIMSRAHMETTGCFISGGRTSNDEVNCRMNGLSLRDRQK